MQTMAKESQVNTRKMTLLNLDSPIKVLSQSGLSSKGAWYSIAKTKIAEKFKKSLKGIDKIKEGFIIYNVVGKNGEKG